MSSEKFYLPKHLDAPPKLLLWSMDDALVILMPLFLGTVIGLGIFTPIIAFLCGYFWKKIKGSGGTKLIKALIYWHYPAFVLGLKNSPKSSIKKYIS